MAYSTTNLYPEDLYGTNPANLITNEPQTLQVPGPGDYYFIIPKAAPFFVDSVKVLNAATMQPYVEGDDYQLGHQFIEAMDSTGRPIAGSIRFMRPTITGQVLVTYRTLGGPWGFSDQAIMRELSNKLVNPLIRSWGDIDPLPYSFPPLPHDQRIDTLVGSKDLNDSLKRIADILEATAAGTTQSHLVDYNNPHRTTAIQVGLGNVPNFSMATEQQHLEATATNLFTNPRGVLAMINLYAVDPLNTHINATGNVHSLTAAEIGLGNVPNWLPATAATATDPTNNAAFMTPYTTTLLIQQSVNDPRLDQLIIDFNDHLIAPNPHHITPQMIGTYTSEQIDEKIQEASAGGGDAGTFGGETPTEWEAKFPANDDINTILDEQAVTFQNETVKLTQLDAEDPVTEQQRNERNARRIGSSFGSYGAYGLYNTYGDLKLVFDPTVVGTELPTTVVVNGAMRWATAQNAGYFLTTEGSISTGGSEAITVPTEYAQGAGFVPANACKHIYASKDYLYLHRTDNKLMLLTRGSTTLTEVGTYQDIDNLYTNNGMLDPRVFSVVRTPVDENSFDWSPIGDTSWVTAANTIKTLASSQGYTVVDVRVGTEYFNVIVTKANVYTLWIYKINYGEQITMTDVTATIDIMNHTTGISTKANTVVGITQLAGSYDHFVFTQPIPGTEPGGNGEPEDLCLLYSFGSNSNGQLEITSASGPFFTVGAGYGYTVTINKQHFAEFWGDSPNNSLIYTGGSLILPPTP